MYVFSNTHSRGLMYITLLQISLAFSLCFPFLEPPEAAESLTEIAGGGRGEGEAMTFSFSPNTF